MSPSEGGDASVPAPFQINDLQVAPGTRGRTSIPVARLVTGEWLSFPVEVLHGTEPGPVLWLSGAVHGDELDGVEIIRRVSESLEPARLRGTVLALPVVNLFGFVNESRYLPDRRDLNRSFPGSTRGSLGAQLAHLFMKEIVDRCEYGIDFHCGSDDRENLPQIRANLDDEVVAELAAAFAAPLMIHGKPPDKSLRKASVARGAKILLYEAGQAGRYTESAIRQGVDGALRVLSALGMTPDPALEPAAPSVVSRSTHWIRAPRSGVCRLSVALGATVDKAQKMGEVSEITGEDGRVVKSRHAGIVIGRRVSPLVYRGEAVVHVAIPE